MSKYRRCCDTSPRPLFDPMNLYMCLFPIVMLFLASFVFPLIFESADLLQETMLRPLCSCSWCILALDPFSWRPWLPFCSWNRRMNTPAHHCRYSRWCRGYLRFKMAYIYVMSVLGNTVILLGTSSLLATDTPFWAHRSSIRLTFCTLSPSP